jgi:hypothetical protein
MTFARALVILPILLKDKMHENNIAVVSISQDNTARLTDAQICNFKVHYIRPRRDNRYLDVRYRFNHNACDTIASMVSKLMWKDVNNEPICVTNQSDKLIMMSCFGGSV